MIPNLYYPSLDFLERASEMVIPRPFVDLEIGGDRK